MTAAAGVTRAQLEALAARAPARPTFHPSRRARGEAVTDLADRARRYLATIPGAVSGDRGHDRTFRAACKLVIGFALTPDAAYPYLEEWNATCTPPWSEYDLRRKLEQADSRPGPRGFLLAKEATPPGAAKHASGIAGAAGGAGAFFRNYLLDEQTDGETTRRIRRGRGGAELLEELADYTGGWPRRSGKMLFARGRGEEVLWFKQATELFAWIDWQYRIDGGRGFDWQSGIGCLTQAEFFEACRIHCENWNQVELYPHEPRIPGHYYHHPELPADADGSALTELVRRFSPASPLDDDLIRLMFISMVWGGLPGKRPVFVIESAKKSTNGGRGAGKTTLASTAAKLVGGYISISPGERIEEIHKRLLSPGGLTKRVGLIDNLKSLRFSSSDLEGLITSEVISGRQMFTGEGSRPNTLTWLITSNMPALSKDLAQRSVIVRVTTPAYDPEWGKQVEDHIEANRWAIIADCIAEIRRPSTLPEGIRHTRWSEWENDVLAKAPDARSLASELLARQQILDDDREIADEVADAVRELVKRKGFDDQKDCVLIPSQVLYEEIVKKFGGSHLTRTGGLRWLYTMGIECLSKWDASLPYRGGVWRPDQADENARPKNWADRFGTTGLPE